MQKIVIGETTEEAIYCLYDADSKKLMFNARFDMTRTSTMFVISLEEFLNKVNEVPKKRKWYCKK